MTVMRHLHVAPEPPVSTRADLPLSRTTLVNDQQVAVFVNYDGTPTITPYAQMTQEDIALWEDPEVSQQINAGLRDVAEGRVVPVKWDAFWESLSIGEDDV